MQIHVRGVKGQAEVGTLSGVGRDPAWDFAAGSKNAEQPFYRAL